MNYFLDALKKRDIERIRTLLEQGADPNSEFEGKLSLHYALGAPDLMRMLLHYGARPSLKDQRDRSLLVDALYSEDIISINLLLSAGVDPNRPDEEGHTPLGCATYCLRNEEMVKLLLFYNAHTNQFDEARKVFPFIEAARNFNVAMVKEFLERGANPLVTTKTGGTALMAALCPGNIEVITFLLHCGIPINYQDKWGDTALHWAAELADYELIELLVTRGADVTIKNNEENTPLKVLLMAQGAPTVIEHCAQLLK